MFAEWDELRENNPELISRLWRLTDEFPQEVNTGFYRALFGGVALGAAPCFLAEFHELSMQAAVPLTAWVAVVSSLGWGLTSCFPPLGSLKPNELRKKFVELLAQRDALKNGFSDEDLDVIHRVCEIAWETKKKGKKISPEIEYYEVLVKNCRMQNHEDYSAAHAIARTAAIERKAQAEAAKKAAWHSETWHLGNSELRKIWQKYTASGIDRLSITSRLRKIKERIEVLSHDGITIQELIRKDWVGGCMVDARNLYLALEEDQREEFRTVCGLPDVAAGFQQTAQIKWLQMAVLFFEKWLPFDSDEEDDEEEEEE